MRKSNLFIILGLFLSLSAYAKTALRIPVFIEGKKNPVSASEINKKLKKSGGELLPTYIELSSRKDAEAKLKALDAQIEESLKTLGKEYKDAQRNGELVPGEHNADGLETCYLGNALKVPGIVTDLADVYYSDQLNLLGYKYKKTTEITDDSDKEGTARHLTENSKLWREWRGQGEAILVLTAVGDGGDDVNESLIKRCRK